MSEGQLFFSLLPWLAEKTVSILTLCLCLDNTLLEHNVVWANELPTTGDNTAAQFWVKAPYYRPHLPSASESQCLGALTQSTVEQMSVLASLKVT